jgi:choline dehydrogenase
VSTTDSVDIGTYAYDGEPREYDYVIVGGGTAGCVLAARLTEDPGCRVLLIEAGPDHVGSPIDDPARWVELSRGDFDWGYDYEPSPALAGRVIPMPRGRVLGGSSAINAMLWYRGHPSDYDLWAELGATGWNYRALLPYFIKCEDWQGGASEQRGAGGPMRIETSPNPHPIALALLDAAAELGLPVIEDPNGASNEGAALSNLMVRGSRRCSTAVAYLQPARGRPNLTVRCESLALELVFQGDRCVGVRHVVDGRPVVSRAEAEVLLCLGAVGTPQLLLLSGIGDPASLRPLGLDVRIDLPGVGRNLQDHPLLMGMNFRARSPLGPVRDNGGGSMLNWRSDPALAAPDLHAFVVQGPHADEASARRYDMDGDIFAISPGLMRSTSVGRVMLRSADPACAPRIDSGFLTERADVDALIASIDVILDLAATRAYADLIASPAMPAGRLSYSDKESFVRATTSTFFHAAGTCAIGPVLRPDLGVHGTSGLRVVDASVFPSLPSCNTTAPVIAVAERAADLIRASRGISPSATHYQGAGNDL